MAVVHSLTLKPSVNHCALPPLGTHSHSNPSPNEDLLGNASLLVLSRNQTRCLSPWNSDVAYWGASLLSAVQAKSLAPSHCSPGHLLTNFSTLKQLSASSDSLPEALCSWQRFLSPALNHLSGSSLLLSFSYSGLTFSVFIAVHIKAVFGVQHNVLGCNCLHQAQMWPLWRPYLSCGMSGLWCMTAASVHQQSHEWVWKLLAAPYLVCPPYAEFLWSLEVH